MSEAMKTAIEGLMSDFSTGISGVDYTLLLQPMVDIFPTVFTIMLALAGIKKAIGFVRGILNV